MEHDMFKTNLHDELFKILKDNNKTVDDIFYVNLTEWKSKQQHFYKPEKFIKRAKNINYNSGYGSEEIRRDLKIVLKNGDFIIRREYDGSEWFEYMESPKTDVELEDLLDSEYLDYYNRESKVSPLDYL